jgi:FtsH-binding integral membrane protein
MFVVRYATLAALVLWLGAMLGARFGDAMRQLPLLAVACGAVTFIGLFAMKFMGPPPPSFLPRVAIVFVMLAIAAASAWLAPSAMASTLLAVNIALGFLLLYWYTRE